MNDFKILLIKIYILLIGYFIYINIHKLILGKILFSLVVEQVI